SELLLCHGMVCVVGRMRDLILQLSKSSIYSTKPETASYPSPDYLLIAFSALSFFSRTALISSLYLHSDAIFFASPKVNGSDEVPVLV
ncbi:MAG: hypothetical protein E7D21_08125, partial [Veillonella sp.]|nr:hypothetical protein [Veillonella sp.]